MNGLGIFLQNGYVSGLTLDWLPPLQTVRLHAPAHSLLLTALTPVVVNNPGTTRNPGSTNTTIYPYDVNNPLNGDPVLENATALINRHA